MACFYYKIFAEKTRSSKDLSTVFIFARESYNQFLIYFEFFIFYLSQLMPLPTILNWGTRFRAHILRRPISQIESPGSSFESMETT
jgi:hypothetical protein